MNLTDLIRNPSARSALFIDTNILVLFVVGACDPALLTKCKRAAQFDQNDLKLLIKFSNLFQTVSTTPSVLTEVCNLLESFNKEQGYRVFATIVSLLKSMKERHVPALQLSGDPAFLRIGLADTSLLSAASKGAVILSDDLKFCSEVWGRGFAAVNFNHLRSEVWFGSS